MIKFFILISLSYYTLFCTAQRGSKDVILQNEILTAFLNTQKPYSYVNKRISDLDLATHFIANYKSNLSFYKTADSVCTTSSDTTALKFYCPLADVFSKFDGLIDENNLEYLKKEYAGKGKTRELNLDSILSHTVPLLQHSQEYYKAEKENKLGNTTIKEFPSIRILAILITKAQNIAVVAYSIDGEGLRHGLPSYFLLQNKRDIWWKPIGNLRI